MERDSFIFYSSFYQAWRYLDNKNRLDYYDRINNYWILWIDKPKSPTVEALFSLIKPLLDSNNKKYLDWCKWWKSWKLWWRPKSKFSIGNTNNNPSGRKNKTPNVEVYDDVSVSDDNSGEKISPPPPPQNLDVKKKEKMEFAIFWDTYWKKVWDKDKCMSRWNKLNLDTQEKIIETIPAFKIACWEKQYRPHPLTYLNQKRWNDELEPIKEKTMEEYAQEYDDSISDFIEKYWQEFREKHYREMNDIIAKKVFRKSI